MSTKRMMMAMMVAIITGTLIADVSVEDVKCTQRYPWNGLVDIEYTIACDDPEAEIYVNPVGFNGDTGLTVFPTHFTGDGATNTVKAGKHTMVWDAKADLGGTFATKNFQIKMYAGKKLSRYIVIDVSGGTDATEYAIRHSIEGPNLADDTCRTTEIWMRLIPPGTFMMGSPIDELGRYNNEALHKVTITRPYYMGVFEVTQRQWELVMGTRPSGYKSELEYGIHPVETVTYGVVKSGSPNYKYYDKVWTTTSTYVDPSSFLGRIRSKTNSVGFDLPSEAQWEYACRAGVYAAKYDGHDLMGHDGDEGLNSLGRYLVNGTSTAGVGSYLPNRCGLYDMLGNVFEMCRDGRYDYDASNPATDPVANWTFSNESYLIVRGGSWNSAARNCRCAYRWIWNVFWARGDAPGEVNTLYSRDNIGFRLMTTESLQQ